MKGPVKTYMSGDPVSIPADACALEAFEAMLDRGVRHLPVIDDRHRVVGVLSIDDVRAALPYPVSLRQPLAPSQRDAALALAVGEIMTRDPETLGEDATLAEAAECMATRRIGCVPIVDADGELAGLLSETDVLWAVATADGAHRKSTAIACARCGDPIELPRLHALPSATTCITCTRAQDKEGGGTPRPSQPPS